MTSVTSASCGYGRGSGYLRFPRRALPPRVLRDWLRPAELRPALATRVAERLPCLAFDVLAARGVDALRLLLCVARLAWRRCCLGCARLSVRRGVAVERFTRVTVRFTRVEFPSRVSRAVRRLVLAVLPARRGVAVERFTRSLLTDSREAQRE
jgi:hypothetical protein